MRIAFLTTEFTSEPDFSGGLANYLLRTSRALQQSGHQPEVFCISGSNETIAHDGIPVHRVHPTPPLWIRMADRLALRSLHRPLSCLSHALAIGRRIKAAHARRAFDIVQAASYRAIGLFSSPNVPLVIRISSLEPLWRRVLDTRCTLEQKVTEQLELMALHRSTACYAPSHMLANAIRPVLKKNVDVIRPPFTVDVEIRDRRFFETELRTTEYLLFFGTISPLKGGVTIAETIPSILQKYPDLQFVLIGKSQNYGGQSMIGYILQTAGPLKARVRHFDPQPHRILYPVIQNARGIILPSLVDNFPNTCLEAMALKQLVVGTTGSSMEELITDGKNGFLCRPGDPNSLLAAIEKMLNLSETEANKIKQNAGQSIERLSPALTIPPLIDFYARTIRGTIPES